MVVDNLKLNAKVKQLFDEIQIDRESLKEKKQLHLRLIEIQERTRKVISGKNEDGTDRIITEDIEMMDEKTGSLMTDRRRQEIYDAIKLTGIDI